MAYRIIEIEGIGELYEAKLGAAGIDTTEQLLEAGKTPEGRLRLSEATGINNKLILKWVNHADLFRIKGVAGQFAELLEASESTRSRNSATACPKTFTNAWRRSTRAQSVRPHPHSPRT